MSDTNAENPFTALLSKENIADGISKDDVEKIFLLTLHKSHIPNRSCLLCLADVVVQDSSTDKNMSWELMEHVLFERLMLKETRVYLVRPFNGEELLQEAVEENSLLYLYRAYNECCKLQTENKTELNAYYDKIKDLILTNTNTFMRHAELFEGQAPHMQWLTLFEEPLEVDPNVKEFLVKSVLKLIENEDDPFEALGCLKSVFYPLLGDIQKQVSESNIVTLKRKYFFILEYFVIDKRVPQLGELFIDFTTPNPGAKGGEYMDTLLGQLLCLSILPKNSNGRYEFFTDMSLELNQTDSRLWEFMSSHQQSIFKLIKQLLVMGTIPKKKTLQWMANCLQANSSRGQIWSNMNVAFDHTSNQTASDAFMTGLTAVLLRLCEPLCSPGLKVLMVDPTYYAVKEEERQDKQVSMQKLSEETCLLSAEENVERPTCTTYNFITEIFYLTHKAYVLSYRHCIDRCSRMARELENLRTAYQDVVNTNPDSDLARNLVNMLKEQMQNFLCMRNTLLEPLNDTLLAKFFEASSIWLVRISLISKEEYEAKVIKKDFAPMKITEKELPTTHLNFVPEYLSSVPEGIIDNIVSYMSFSRYFPTSQYIDLNPSSHDALFKMIILFMGSPELAKNPHLRAKLAEALEIILPSSSIKRKSFTTHVFDSHEDRMKVVPSLLNVFVSIEMTGQSVQFEQKFNYRRPMYAIMNYLWTKPEQVQCFRDLANEAERNMEAVQPPLFLRFINLLINDAIFLLDESLSNLQQIRVLQEAQARGDWEKLNQNERQQMMTNFHHLGILARFDNLLGRETINILKLLTMEIKSIFCHASMVDRMAAMLNYFLLNLVGPKKEQFKVKDKKEFEFDPAQTVLEICHIYINLSESESFSQAVFQDGRSYSPQLFKYTENILIRIGGGQMIGDMADFAEKVQKMQAEYDQEQVFMSEAPEEFLDPIMSTIMTDPVLLPSSKVVVDRSTIARHLLSDQTDPFNRAPLTMDKVISNVELKNDIDKWIAERRASAKKSESEALKPESAVEQRERVGDDPGGELS